MLKLKPFIIFTACVAVSVSVSAQTSQSSSHSQSHLSQEFTFDGETGDRQVVIDVHQETRMLSFMFQSKISAGNLTMNIFDPNGKGEGGFVLEAVEQVEKGATNNSNQNSNQNSNNGVHTYTMVHSKGGKSSGSMNKQIEHPIPGVWTVKISAKELTGSLGIHLGQQSPE